MNPQEQVIVFDKLSEKRQNEILLKQLSDTNITKDNITDILKGMKIDSKLYDVLSSISIGNFITTKLSSDQKRIVYNKFAIFLKDFDNLSTIDNKSNKGKNENSEERSPENLEEKSRAVTIDGVPHTRTVSQIFATDKSKDKDSKPLFTNHVEIDGKKFKSKLTELRKDNDKPVNFILGKDIKNSDSEKNLKLNGKIIKTIVKQQYEGSWFAFIKASGLLKLNGYGIDKSELSSYRGTFGNWRSDDLGNSGRIWLRALVANGGSMYVKFDQNSADQNWSYSDFAMRVASQ